MIVGTAEVYLMMQGNKQFTIKICNKVEFIATKMSVINLKQEGAELSRDELSLLCLLKLIFGLGMEQIIFGVCPYRITAFVFKVLLLSLSFIGIQVGGWLD